MCGVHPAGESSAFRSKFSFYLALFVDGSLDFIEPTNFVRVRFRNDNVIWLKESSAGRRVEVVGVEVGKFGLDGVVDGDVLGSGVAVVPFEVDEVVAGGPCGSVGVP